VRVIDRKARKKLINKILFENPIKYREMEKEWNEKSRVERNQIIREIKRGMRMKNPQLTKRIEEFKSDLEFYLPLFGDAVYCNGYKLTLKTGGDIKLKEMGYYDCYKKIRENGIAIRLLFVDMLIDEFFNTF
jgi:hypothetical protein